MLSSKSDQEISWMLDDYGIKHGPVVGSTRSLYEKKLRDIMAKERKMRGTSEPVVYREQRDEDVSFYHHRPWGHDVFSSRRNPVFSAEYRDIVSRPMVSPYYTESQGKYTAVTQERTQGGTQGRTQGRTQERTPDPGSGRSVPLWLQIVFFLIVAGVLVFIFINIEPAQSEPFKQLT
ncbi:emerin (Emery-Dreifuss muscular dystrophy) isoform X2 [Silurus meridionalis]|uniref:emerin (Emery-Dreifuss muscular dystrophy) isoform X2 n=1 Tax=Silurus meridionalis TaxID=175797 RepID=UPI001EEBF9E3|nr:emerin (Emery-Dreifuss muscular dystrophy) isoform X2 [Silurus meridionalis]